MRILTVANIVPRKNIDLCVKTAKYINAHLGKNVTDYPQEKPFPSKMEWIVVGSGDREYEQGIIQKAPENMFFFERLTREDLVKFYEESDVFVLPSQDEGFGMVFAEALWHNLPVVYYYHGGVDNLIKDCAMSIPVDLTPESIAIGAWSAYNAYKRGDIYRALLTEKNRDKLRSVLSLDVIRKQVENEIKQVFNPSNDEIIEKITGFCPNSMQKPDNYNETS